MRNDHESGRGRSSRGGSKRKKGRGGRVGRGTVKGIMEETTLEGGSKGGDRSTYERRN